MEPVATRTDHRSARASQYNPLLLKVVPIAVQSNRHLHTMLRTGV